MFTKSKSVTPPTTPVTPKAGKGGPPSIIATDMKIFGDLETDGDVQVDGEVKGDLRTRSVTIGTSAVIKGAITGETVIVSGSVNGQINGTKVVLTATAHVVGDIVHDSLSIDAGAFLEGLCKRRADTLSQKGAKAQEKEGPDSGAATDQSV